MDAIGGRTYVPQQVWVCAQTYFAEAISVNNEAKQYWSKFWQGKEKPKSVKAEQF